ncbi:hypothetical protein GTY41_02485 [Streptomyces sp. SID685]|uniref:hypothetical protein n=1 Tax=Streptomyces sp. SID685 TaxID=2690322 RepID=UPI00136B9981|nr:hypothetical protein [Streptomyces sp. SID685]MYR83842.1 hypothetical protein [Streptomyces sp. SID685]
MTAAAVDPASDETRALIGRLQTRVAELEAELKAQERINFELRAAADASRNFKASRAAGYIDLDLDRI